MKTGLYINQRFASTKNTIFLNESVLSTGTTSIPINELTFFTGNNQLLIGEKVEKKGKTSVKINEVVQKFINQYPANSNKKSYQFEKPFNIDNFNVKIYINGAEFDKCLLNIEINRAENSASLAKLSYKLQCHDIDNFDCGIYFFIYLGKKIDIFYLSNTKNYLLYRGIISDVQADSVNDVVSFSCTDENIHNINNLSYDFISTIGYFSEKLFPDLTKEEEFYKRMESIPFSYCFDNQGNFRLISWNYDYDKDSIYLDCNLFLGDSLKIGNRQTAKFINKFNINFNFVYPRFLERKINYIFDNGRDWSQGGFVCDIMRYNFLFSPPAESLLSAINSAGWDVENFSYTGLPKAGTYTCTDLDGNRGEYIWNPNGISYNYKQKTDADGNTITQNGKPLYDVDYATRFYGEKFYASSARWTYRKRWIQNVEEQHSIIIQNIDSIKGYGLKEESINFSIKFDVGQNDDWTNLKCSKKTTNSTLANGDGVLDIRASYLQDFEQAVVYVENYGNRKILDSHRHLNFEVDTKNLFLNLGDQFSGAYLEKNIYLRGIVSNLRISLDFQTSRAFASVGCRALVNESEKYYSNLDFNTIVPDRPIIPVAQRKTQSTRLGLHIVGKPLTVGMIDIRPRPSSSSTSICDIENGDDGLYGYVVNRTLRNDKDKQGIFSPIKFAVKTPEIEKESTDAVVAKSELVLENYFSDQSITSYDCCKFDFF